jgi:hypothetical protein
MVGGEVTVASEPFLTANDERTEGVTIREGGGVVFSFSLFLLFDLVRNAARQ